MKKKFYMTIWIILGLCFIGMYFLTREDEHPKTTKSDKTENVAKNPRVHQVQVMN